MRPFYCPTCEKSFVPPEITTITLVELDGKPYLRIAGTDWALSPDQGKLLLRQLARWVTR